MFRERMKTMPADIREKRFRNVGDPRRTDRFRSTYEHGVESPFVVHAVAAYEKAFKLLEQTLVEQTLADGGGLWILGPEPSLADINLMPFAARLDYLGLLDLWTANRPHAERWWVTARTWPHFKSGLSDLVTDGEIAEMRSHGPKIRAGVAAHLNMLRSSTAA
jgi:glutathione S-transferase